MTAPEPVKVIPVEFVQAADIQGSLARPATDQASSSRALERTVSNFAPAATEQHQPFLRGSEDKTPTAAETQSDATATEIEKAPAERSVGPSSPTSKPALPPPIPRAKPAWPNRSTDPTQTKSARQDEPERLKDDSQKRAGHGLAVVPAVDRSRVHEGTGDSPAAPPRFDGPGLSNPPPRYPYLARRRGQEGRVVLRVQVSARGDAKAVAIQRSSGYRLLDEAALEAVRKWRFVPANRGGSKVPAPVDVPISFKLTD